MLEVRLSLGLSLLLVVSGCAAVTGRRSGPAPGAPSARVSDEAQAPWYARGWTLPKWGRASRGGAKRPSMWQKMSRGTTRFVTRTKNLLTPGDASKADQSFGSVTDFLRQPKVMPSS